jgi:hypothetical protein
MKVMEQSLMFPCFRTNIQGIFPVGWRMRSMRLSISSENCFQLPQIDRGKGLTHTINLV